MHHEMIAPLYMRSSIAAHRWESKIDLENAFYSMSDNKEEDRWKTAFLRKSWVVDSKGLALTHLRTPGRVEHDEMRQITICTC